MKNKKCIMTLIGFLSAYSNCFSALYYVDYLSGNDLNDGLSASTAWKHSPGDPNAQGVPAVKSSKNDPLRPGDILLFKGGVVYRGSIRLDGRWISGAVGNPITLKGDGWGSEKAVLDGSANFESSWERCRSSEDCAGSSAWNSIYYAAAPDGWAYNSGFYEAGSLLSYSQDPNPVDPFFYDRLEYLRVIPLNDPEIKQTRVSVTDPRYFNQPDPLFWNGAYVAAWRVPNVISIKKITGFDPASHTIYHEDLGGDLYSDRDSYYTVINHPALIDTPGEYALDESKGVFYVYPTVAPPEISVQLLGAGVYLASVRHARIEGFIVQNYVFGIRVLDSGSGITPENVVIKNNEVRSLKSDGNYAIQASGIDMVVENNSVEDCQRAVGILGGGTNLVFRNNYVKRSSRQGIWFMGAKNSVIEGNIVEECRGTHANGISVYSNSENVTVRGNIVRDSNIAFTFEQSSGFNIFNNIFDGNDLAGYVVAGWGGLTGSINFFNNTVVGSTNNASVYISGCGTENSPVLKNNILDGGGCGERSHNIYISLNSAQSARYGWSFAEGEFLEPDILKLFTNPSSGNYALKENSPAVEAGTALTGFNTDIQGASRPQGTGWDIGAYEYSAGGSTAPRPPFNLEIR